MTTQVILTGTGVPHPRPGRAGAGTLVRCGDVALQFDAGRATVLRLVEAGVEPRALTALFVTHVHSDHVVGLPDVAMTCWVQQQLGATGPLVVVAPEGAAARFVRRMLDPFDDDIAVRREHLGAGPVGVDLRPIAVPPTPQVVWASDAESVRVLAVAVHHEPVADAVAYRVETPDGVVVVSGDTRERAGVPHVVLTHLIPPPDRPEDAAAFADDLRAGGFTGRITVGEDLTTVTLDECRIAKQGVPSGRGSSRAGEEMALDLQ